MFPNGSSTGLANAKPFGPLIAAVIPSIADNVFSSIFPKKNGNQNPGTIYQGSYTNYENAHMINDNFEGTINYGSSTTGNNYGPLPNSSY